VYIMARANTSSTKNTKATKAATQEEPVTSAAVPNNTAATTNATLAAKKKKKTVPEETPVAPAVSQPAKVEQVAEQEGGEDEVVTYASMHSSLLAHLQGMIHETKDLMKTVRSMKTMHDKEVKESKVAKKAPRRPRTTQAGFAVPTRITPQLAAYIGSNSLDSLSRTDAVKRIHAKIIQNGLQDPEDRRVIRYEMDKEFKALLGLPGGFQVNKKGIKDTNLTYFNLQRYISQHFIKE
jgi:chromatin remodeling complex protein RSC6